MIYSFGLLVSFWATRKFPVMDSRKIAFLFLTHMFFIGAVTLPLQVSYYRLIGTWDNGLRWKKPDYQWKKFDTTSVYEHNTIWKRFRINY